MSRSRLIRQARRTFTLSLSALLCFSLGYGSSSLTAGQNSPIPLQRSTGSSSHVGSAMAVLATLQEAQVLPPEGSREADRVIQSVIQFQSAFAKGTDRFIQDFVEHAVAGKHGAEAPLLLERFRARGWSAEILEALADADQRLSPEERERLATGFGQFNLSVADFRRFMRLIRDGRSAFSARGQDFEEVFARHRNTMPGAAER